MVTSFQGESIPEPKTPEAGHKLRIIKGADFNDLQRIGPNISNTAKLRALRAAPFESVCNLVEQLKYSDLAALEIRQIVIVHTVHKHDGNPLDRISIVRRDSSLAVEACMLETWWPKDTGFVFLD